MSFKNKIKVFFCLLTFAITTQYGPFQMVRFIRYEHPELKSYYKKYSDIFPKGISTKITFHKYWFDSENVLAKAYIFLFSKNEIHVDPVNWKWLTPIQKEMLILHELGHSECYILKHNDKRLTDGCYASIMSTYIDTDECLKKHYHELRENFKKQCN